MTKHLRNDLEKLERALLALGTRVEDATRRAISALRARRPELALEVIGGDDAIDRAEVLLEEDCLKALALHQPVAGDLRFITACLKITNDLERIGDLAVNIAERADALDRTPRMPSPENLETMTEVTTTMLREALDSFVRSDVTRARRVMAMDDEVDNLHRATIHEMVAEMKADSGCIDEGLLYISVSRHLERIADHCTNIAEDVVYMVEGDIVRHNYIARK